MAATDKHATTEEMLEEVVSVRSVPSPYNDGQRPIEKSFETAVRRIGGWSRMAASLGLVSGVEWSGVEWSGVEWSGVEWSGVEWSGVNWLVSE
jgi:hypothetical protein